MEHPCLICNRPQDDPLHGPERPGSRDITPRVDQHEYDPGERRQGTRRMDDRVDRLDKAMRRQDDRRKAPHD